MRQVTVDIKPKTVVRTLFIIVAFILGLMFLQKMGPALKLIGLSFFLALALNSSVNFLAKRLPGKSRALATGVSYLAVVFVFGVLTFSTIPTVYHETIAFINSIPQHIDSIQREDSPVSQFIDRYDLQDDIDRQVASFKENTDEIGNYVVGSISRVTNSVVTLVTILVLTFLMLVEGPRWQKRLWGLYGDTAMRKRHEQLAGRMYRVVTGYVNGQVAIAAIAATTTLVVLLVLSAVFDTASTIALPMAGIIFVTGLIPMIGATLGALLVSIFLVFSSIPSALIFLAYFIAYQQFENYVIQPMVQSRALDLSPLIVFVAALAGFYLMGPIGGFVAIPIAGCLRVLVLDYLSHRKVKGSEQKEESRVAKKELLEI